MRLRYLSLGGFRGYQKELRIEFGDQFTIIDGRNGVGKSTIFDAIEFALTGSISKYPDAKAAGQTVSDYIWWAGDASDRSEKYVEVGFKNALNEEIQIRRSQLGAVDKSAIENVTAALCDVSRSPQDPLKHLCSAAIVRDEHITRLSLDLGESDRYARLREALGGSAAERTIERGSKLVSLAKKQRALLEQEVAIANAEMAQATRLRDQRRASVVSDAISAEVVGRLQEFANTKAPVEELAGRVRARLGVLRNQSELLRRLIDEWDTISAERSRVGQLTDSLSVRIAAWEEASRALQDPTVIDAADTLSAVATEARSLADLLALGRQIGLKDGHCPLCGTEQSRDRFEQGLAAAERFARQIDNQAVLAVKAERTRDVAKVRLAEAAQAVEIARMQLDAANARISLFDSHMTALGVGQSTGVSELTERGALLKNRLETAERDLHTLEEIESSTVLEEAARAEADAVARLAKVQERFGRVRRAETQANALYDAARRANNETLNRRLDRVLPLLSELYGRLRPHPVWTDIQYAIRGDVRRFMTLRVGESLNPQFIFSSGQRRATGLAFLLAINLSLAWSRWQSILLDDPVQHIDDFRAVHLAEVMAQLVSGGRQVICAVEDEALADLLSRRLPMASDRSARRLTLGREKDGSLGVLRQVHLRPLVRNALVEAADHLAAS